MPTTPTASNRLLAEAMQKAWVPPGTPAPTEEQMAQSRNIQGDLPGQDFLDRQQAAITPMLSGEIPKDVQDQVMRISAEKAINSGLGQGQAARNLTARDLGLTSLDIQGRGLQAAGQLSQIQGQFNSLEEQSRQWNDKFLLDTRGTNLESAKITLAGYELIANIQMQSLKLANDLIIANSTREIAGVQENIDTLLGTDGKKGFPWYTEQAILDFIRSY